MLGPVAERVGSGAIGAGSRNRTRSGSREFQVYETMSFRRYRGFFWSVAVLEILQKAKIHLLTFSHLGGRVTCLKEIWGEKSAIACRCLMAQCVGVNFWYAHSSRSWSLTLKCKPVIDDFDKGQTCFHIHPEQDSPVGLGLWTVQDLSPQYHHSEIQHCKDGACRGDMPSLQCQRSEPGPGSWDRMQRYCKSANKINN